MRLVGSSPRWRDRFLAIHGQITNGIERAWPACRLRCNPTSLENHVTRRLVILLKQDLILRASPGHIISQYELLPEDLAGDVSPKGYIDIAVVFRIEREEVYMAYECKRLNVCDSGARRKSLATEYIKEGMLRFVCAQYAQGLPFGAMLGYVMDGDATFACDSVKERIRENAGLLRCKENLPKDIEPRGTFHSFTTIHQRPSCDIELRHVMLPL